ncbi:nucleolar protein 10 [Chrysoperla carnea]|uniref:nucleolar protein 10 n=1 Tax=Chrysoperla carnea TaxID=189513 RepID=UPI001D08F705|nr:nucleolar protein 10 [Chrysoperla carnea]
MQVSDANNVKIYNLSAGKSLPEWLSERKRRALLKKNVDIRRRIELIQDFDMPGLSTSIQMSKDGQYIFASGIYKPRIKCFDVNNLSLKFERCFDSEVVAFEVLSDDYSKIVFLQCDRYVEFHSAGGRYYRLRIPRFGRDLKYHYPSCDLFLVGTSPEIYRLNLERGQFLQPFTTQASIINKCDINPVHHLLVCGTQEGRIEAWDPRVRERVGSLDCAFNCVNDNGNIEGFPSISALKFHGGLQLGVGTATGQILLYDIRSNKPYFIKDHMYGLPIKNVEFHNQQDLIYSMDSSILKIWNKNDGKIFTSIEASTEFNDLCVVPNSGMMFMATENTKMQSYYIPGLGPAPKWASFLDSLTEELEESNSQIVYDDYKFVTKSELESLGLDHLLGTNLLRAYMHGYFIDIRLYKKAKSVAEPFAFDEYRKKKIREKIEEERTNRVQLDKLPKINKELALKFMETEINDSKKKKKSTGNIMEDNRFKALFANPDFQIDKNADEYRLLNPVLSRLDKTKEKQLKKHLEQQFEEVEEELEGKNSSDESSSEEEEEESSDDDHTWTKEVKKQHRIIQREHKAREYEEEKKRLEAEEAEANERQPKFFEIKDGEEFTGIKNIKRKANKISLGERLQEDTSNVRLLGSVGNREMKFTTKRKSLKAIELRNQRHREERKKLIRPAKGIIKRGSKFKR